MLDQARRAPQTVTADWTPLKPPGIEGVKIKEIKNVVIKSGVLTECFRPEWFGSSFQAAHVVYMALLPGGLSNWHCHRRQSDVIIAIRGQLRIGMYDDRPESASYKAFVTLNVSVARPSAILVPPLVWHAIKNPSGEEGAYIVVNDEVFHYDEPDDWTLPPGSDAIPCRLD
jgi:dTDP-4-dehydrorhamnose 3,5-epimerase